jgi:hypothetical protein
MLYLLLTEFVLLVLFLVTSKHHLAKANAGNQTAIDSALTNHSSAPKPSESNYERLRQLAYATPYSALNLPDAGEEEVLYGVLMDWNFLKETSLTISYFKTGKVSVLFSSGACAEFEKQQLLGDSAGDVFLREAAALLPIADPASSQPDTAQGCLQLHLLTNKGKYAVKDDFENVQNDTSPLVATFLAAARVILAVRNAELHLKGQASLN